MCNTLSIELRCSCRLLRRCPGDSSPRRSALRMVVPAMTCLPSQIAGRSGASPERERIRTQALAYLARRVDPASVAADSPDLSPSDRDAALATALMDAFRVTSDSEAFELLVRWAGPRLMARVRSRLRVLAATLDPSEVWQDVIVNIYRYPDRFLASRPGAFSAWSSMIVDNAIRRHLRRSKRDLGVSLRDPELLQDQADLLTREPSAAAQDHEECLQTAAAFSLLLQAYLVAYQMLGERERFVLQMVEVRAMRYAELATILAIRPEALKMVVFRARKRIFDRLQQVLAGGSAPSHRLAAAVA
ncbi:MAG: sigma-70 family RNA polymerase sigma factor [Planctomycetes bacterium]|nr:sigma-70 family RNA polymerase sigma factor [Planctomycetota bacterium]